MKPTESQIGFDYKWLFALLFYYKLAHLEDKNYRIGDHNHSSFWLYLHSYK